MAKLHSSILRLMYMFDLQVMISMKQQAIWHQGSAAAAYCTITLVLSQALQAASQATTPDIASHPDFISLATHALLLAMAMTSCIHPISSTSSGHTQAYSHSERQPGSAGGQYQQIMPPGSGAGGVQQLQAGLESVCQAGRQLLKTCSGAVQMQMASALMLSVLPIVECGQSGEAYCCMQQESHSPSCLDGSIVF